MRLLIRKSAIEPSQDRVQKGHGCLGVCEPAKLLSLRLLQDRGEGKGKKGNYRQAHESGK